MTDGQKSCPQHFSIWVAFIMGMVIVVIAIVVFDRVVGQGRLVAKAKTGLGTSQAPRPPVRVVQPPTPRERRTARTRSRPSPTWPPRVK